jgi:DDB1- and CUL4-associated factor 13
LATPPSLPPFSPLVSRRLHHLARCLSSGVCVDILTTVHAAAMPNLLFSDRDRARKGRASPLPTFDVKGNDKRAVLHRQLSQWFTPVFIRLPWTRERRLRLFLPFPAPIRTQLEQRLGRKPALTLLSLITLLFFWVIYAFSKHGLHFRRWQPPFLRDPPTLVFSSDELSRVWQWEIASGHYQSTRPSKQSRPHLLRLAC